MCFSITLYAQVDTVMQRTGYINCNTTKTKLYIKVVGGKKPYNIKINNTNYNIKKQEDSIIINSGKYNGTITDSLGYTKNILFVVDTLKTPINGMIPIISITNDSLVTNERYTTSITVQTNLINTSYNMWTCNTSFADMPNVTATPNNTIKIQPNYSGNVIFTTMGMYGLCNTLQSQTYKIKVYPNIIKDTLLISKTRRGYNIYGTLPITLHLEIDSVISTRVINTNRFVYDFDTTKSSYIKITNISDTSNLNTRVTIYDSYSYIAKREIEIVDSTLIFYEAFSPGTDGLNDYFYIGNYIDEKTNDFKFGYGSLRVVDRNGFEVYDREIYRNDWNGVSNKNTELADGVYFYTFIPKKITKAIPIKGGSVEIKRN